MTQLPLLEQADGRTLARRGMKRAASRAEALHPGWAEEALGMLRRFLQTQAEPFLAEQFRLWAGLNGLPKAGHPRAFGAVILKAKREGLIKFAGYGQVNNPKAHGTPAGLWERA